MAAPQHLQAANVPGLMLLFASASPRELIAPRAVVLAQHIWAQHLEAAMGFGRGALLWLLGVPLPIILILALFMHH
jgi:hypothetical protein